MATQVEITLTGAAFRKVFTALVLLWVLAECPQATKFYLMEEPETQLYPSLTARFISVMLQTANTAQIQVIITSNTNNVIEIFNEKVALNRSQHNI